MKNRLAIFLIVMLLGSGSVPLIPGNCVPLQPAETIGPADTALPESSVKTGNTALTEAQALQKTLYRVMGVVLIIWAGLGLYLYKIDRSVTRLENTINER